MAMFASSYIPTVAATVTRNADALSTSFPAEPQSLTVYVRLIELGATTAPAVAIICEVAAGLFTTPRLLLFAASSVVNWSMQVNNQVTSNVGLAPNPGQTVELLATLNGANGVLQLTAALDGGTPTVGGSSAGSVLSQAWSAPTLWIGSCAGSGIAFWAYRNLLLARGIQTLAVMRRLAGVN